MDELDQFIDQFYKKYSPNDLPQGDRRLRLKEKLRGDFDGYVGQMYTKYAPNNIPDPTRLNSLKAKYIVAPSPVDPSTPITQEDESPSALEVGAAGVGGINRGLSQVVSSPLKFLGALEETVGGVGYLTQAGEAIEEFTEKYNPRYDNVNQTYQDVSQGLGQGLGMIASAGTSSVPRLAELAVKAPSGVLPTLGNFIKPIASKPAVLGGTMTAVPEWEEAKAAGLDDQQAFEVLMKNYLVGQTEAIPISNLLSRINKITGNRVLETVKAQGIGAIEEGLQEALQTYLSNEIAKEEYDPDRDPLFQVLESAKVGGIVGFILPGMVSLAKSFPADKRVKVERKLGEIQVGSALDEASTGDPRMDSEIDAGGQLDPADQQVLEEAKIADAIQQEQSAVERAEKLEEDLQIANRESDSEGQQKSSEKGTKSAQSEEKLKPSQTPEYKQAVARVEELQKKFAELPIDQNADELLFDLREARQALQKIAGTPKPGKKTSIQKQIEDTTGVTKPEKSIKLTPNEAIKHQVQTFYKGVQEGVYRGKDAANVLVNKVQEAIKDSPLQPKQINSILNRVKKTNLFTPGSISRLNSFIDKVSQDAEYSDKIQQAKEINKKLRKLSKATSSNLQKIKGIAKSFASINPEDTFINNHLDFGSRILQALTSPAKEGYASINVAEAGGYITDLRDKIAEYEEEEVFKEPDGEKRNLKVFTTLRASLEALKDKDTSGFDGDERRTVETLKRLDPPTLNNDQAIAIVRVIDNIIENDDFSNAAAVEPIVKSKEILKALQQFRDVIKKELGVIGRVGANSYQQFTRIFGDSGIAAKIQQLIGIIDVWNAGSRVERQEIELTKELKDKIKEIKKRYKIRVQELSNQIRLVIFSEFYKNYGDDSHIPKIKSNIERTIGEYEKTDPEEAKEWKKAYADFKDLETAEQAKDKITPGLYEVWKFFNQKFSKDINPRLEKVTNELYNKPYVEANNYSHTNIITLTGTPSKETFIEGRQTRRAKVKGRQSKTSLTATRNLNQGDGYSSNFIESQLKGYRDSLYDIEASKPKQLVYETIYTPEFEDVVGGIENAKTIRKMVEEAERIQQGMSRSTANEAVRLLNSFTQFLRNLGSIRALASFSQPFKQVPSVWTKAFFNHAGSGSLDAFFKGIGAINLISTSPNLKKLFDQYTIGVRGERLGGIERGESIGYRLAPGATRWWIRGAEWLQQKSDQFGRLSLKPLTNSDVYAARTTWLGYYLQSLKEQGIARADLNQEYSKQDDPVRKTAAAFAEQMVAETQVPSNPATLAQIIRNENDGGWNFAKNMLLPFSSFSLTAKYRNISDVGKFLRNPNAKNASAVAGDFAEIMAFGAIAYGLLPYYKDWLKYSIEEMFGLVGDDDEEKKEAAKKKSFYSYMVNATIPTAIGTPGEYGTAYLANGLAWMVKNPDASFSEWKKETGGFVYQPDSFDPGVFALGLEPIVEAPSGVIDLIKGEAKDVTLTEEQQNLIALKTLLEFAGIVGIGEADVYNQVKKTLKEQLRQAPTTKPVGRLPVPLPRPLPRPIPAR